MVIRFEVVLRWARDNVRMVKGRLSVGENIHALMCSGATRRDAESAAQRANDNA